MFKAKIFESQIILKCLGARKLKGIIRKAKNRLTQHKPERGPP